MRGLRTSRVLVVDDEAAEAEPLLKALAKLGVGCLYFNGDIEGLPAAPLNGIRLVFLDLRLAAGPTEARHHAGNTVGVLKSLVAAANGETGIVLWTKHEEDIGAFDAELARLWPEFRPAFRLALGEKLRFAHLAERGDLEAVPAEASGERGEPARAAPTAPTDAPPPPLGLDDLVARISGAMTDPAWWLLWEWEQAVHDASCATVALLMQMKAQRPGLELLTVLAKLAESPGFRVTDEQSALSALFEGLNPVHSDGLRQHVRAGHASGAHLAALLAAVNARTPLEPPELSLLNRFILADGGSAGTPGPGDVFLSSSWAGAFPGGDPATTKATLVQDIWSGVKPEEQTRIAGLSELCLVELTPACDFAQQKVESARLLFGILVKGTAVKRDNEKLTMPRTSQPYARQTEFFRISGAGLDGDYTLIVNARWVSTLPFTALAAQTSVIRLRDQIVTDIRAWFASHAARPGYVAVH